MTTVISPSIGHGALFTQAGTGATPGYDAIDDRRACGGDLQEGVMAAGSYEVTQRAAGANMSVDIAANVIDTATGIAARIQGDTVTGQGTYPVPGHSAVINEAITAAHATLPRIDMVVLEIQDNTHDAGGANQARVRVIDGTATSGATLDNRNGAASLPNSCLLLADVLVAATDTSISNSEIRDRRKWARGAFVRILRNTGTSHSTSSATHALIDATNLQPRIECSGVPLRVTLMCATDATGATNRFDVGVDGVAQGLDQEHSQTTRYAMTLSWTLVPTAGSHKIGPMFRSNGTGTLYVYAASTNPLLFMVEEIVRQNTANNATTSG